MGRMFDRRRAPEVAEGMFWIVGMDHVLQHGEDALAIDILHPRVDRRNGEHNADQNDCQPSKRNPAFRHHPDSGKPGGKEAGVEHAMVPHCVIDVIGREQRRNCLEMWRLRRRRRELNHGEVADAEHTDISVAPGLGGDPSDES